jgi:NAD-dependent DNA ligase
MPSHTHLDLDRQIAELIGLLKGFVADGVVNEHEVSAFREWLGSHPDALTAWPARQLSSRLITMLDDGQVDETERQELYELFRAAADRAARMPADRLSKLAITLSSESVTIRDNTFVLPGTFAYGSRRACTDAIVQRGGHVRDSVADMPLTLLVGRALADSPAGRDVEAQVEKAESLRAAGTPIRIVSEEQWVTALTA